MQPVGKSGRTMARWEDLHLLQWEMPRGMSVSTQRKAVVSEASDGHPKVVWLALGKTSMCCDLLAFSMETLVMVVLYFHFKAY